MSMTEPSSVSPTTAIALPSQMRAIAAYRYGTAEVLEQVTLDVPEVGADDVLIAVHAAGIDRGAVHLMAGTPLVIRVLGFGLRRPKQPVPGLEVSGTVVAVGSRVSRFTAGDRVFGVGEAAYAQYAVAKADKLSHLPHSVSFEDAAASSISAVTALQALTDKGGVREGQSVLVIGASGGVGSFAVQFAVALGAEVTAVASAAKAEAVRELGAQRVLDYAREDFLAGQPGYDLIIDAGGLNPIRRLRDALSPTGTLVIVGGEGGSRWTGGIERNLRAAILSLFTRRRLTAFISKDHHTGTDRVAEFIERGAVRPLISHRYPLEQAPRGLADLVAGRITGKAVVTVRTDEDVDR